MWIKCFYVWWNTVIPQGFRENSPNCPLCQNIYNLMSWMRGFPCSTSGKVSNCQCKRCECDPWVGKIPWRRKWQPTPVFLPGESHGERRLVGYSPWGRKESNRTEWLSNWLFKKKKKISKTSNLQSLFIVSQEWNLLDS